MKKTITYLTIFILLFNIIFPLNSVRAHDVELDPESYITMPMSIFGGKGTITISSRLTSSYELYYQQVEVSSATYAQIQAKNAEGEKYANEEKAKLDEEYANVQVLKTEYENLLNDSSATDEEIESARTAANTAVDNYNSHAQTYNAKIQEYNQAIKNLKPTYDENKWIQTTDRSFEIDTSRYTGEFQYVLWAKLVTATGTYYDEGLYVSQGTKETTITLNKTTATIKVGETLKLTATTNSSDTVTWSSNKTDIATVSADGTVTAIAKGGATITATAGEKSATCTVTVTERNHTGEVEGGTGDGTENETGDWTDFSNAKFELKKEGVSDAIIEISNVTPKEGRSYYIYIYLLIVVNQIM